MTVSPVTAAANQPLTVTAEGVRAHAGATLHAGGRVFGPLRADRRGRLASTVRLPRGTRRGRAAVRVRARAGVITVPFRLAARPGPASTSLTVGDRGLRVLLTPSGAGRLVLRGGRFPAHVRVRASMGRAVRRSVRATRRGTFRLTLPAPEGTAGRRIILTAAGTRLSIPVRPAAGQGPAATGQPEGVACPGSGPAGPAPASVKPAFTGGPLVDLPLRLDFSSAHGGIADAGGEGTGFRRVEAAERGSGTCRRTSAWIAPPAPWR